MRASAFKAIAIAALAATSAVSAASAADMAVKAPPPPVEIWNWTGFYIGGNIGYSWGRANADVTYFNPVTGAVIVPPAGSITNRSFNMDGGLLGGQAGYNWQTGSWVWGAEADIQWTRERGGANYLCALSVPVTAGGCTPGLTFTPSPGVTGTSIAFDQSLEWFGTARLRGGWLASSRTLLYVTGGLAYGGLKTSAAIAGVNGNGIALTAAGSTTDTRVGWTIGAGVEGMITQNWTAKLEYLYMDLGGFRSGTVSLVPIAPAALIAAYKFGGPVVAKY